MSKIWRRGCIGKSPKAPNGPHWVLRFNEIERRGEGFGVRCQPRRPPDPLPLLPQRSQATRLPPLIDNPERHARLGAGGRDDYSDFPLTRFSTGNQGALALARRLD